MGNIVKTIKREPAMFLALASSVVMMLGPIFKIDLLTNQQTAINAVAAALVGVITSFAVATDGGLALIVGLLKAVLALGLAFGWKLDPAQQAIIMTVVTTLAQFFVRTQVSVTQPPPDPKPL
jgi:hypothetical protein